MKRISFLVLFLALTLAFAFNEQGYQVGDTAKDFKLKNVDGKTVAMADMPNAKGFIVIFTCNHCPFSKSYEDRIIDLHKNFAPKGFPVIAINPNDAQKQPEDNFEEMVKRAKEKAYPFAYLQDESQEVAKTYGATRTPHVYLLNKEGNALKVAYIGAIDNNSQDAQQATEKYVENAISSLLAGKKTAVTSTKAVGCTIKWK